VFAIWLQVNVLGMFLEYSWFIAGMPSPLPEDIRSVLRLDADIASRLQSISFFGLGLFLSIISVWGLWNYIAKDSGWLPRITLGKAACLVILWGALFVIVLTMISGARELLTPGAWKKTGVTYTLEPTTPSPSPTAPSQEEPTDGK
jgi:hypothetical protein